MEKNVFIKKIFEDIHFLIENYLNNGQFVSYEKWEELDGFVYEKFPFLSITFLVKENSSEDDYYEFINRYKDSISLEVKKIKELFLTDTDDEIKQLKRDNDKLQCIIDTEKDMRFNLEHKLMKKAEEIKHLQFNLKAAFEEIEQLKKRNIVLEAEKPVIKVLNNKQIIAIWSNFYTLPYINDNAIFDETNFDINGFIEVLSTKFSIIITSEELLSNNSLTKVIGLLQSKQSCYTENFNKLMKQYPQKKERIDELNDNNVMQIILSCCPKTSGSTRKYVFGTDTLETAELDVEKLNSILYYNFGLKCSSISSISNIKTIDELKASIMYLWKNKEIGNSIIEAARGISELMRWFKKQ